jgi:hypothetical protein
VTTTDAIRPDAASAVASMRRATRAVLALLEGVSEDAWCTRPAGQEWSIAETVEHLVLSDRGIAALLGRVSSQPLPADTARFDDDAISDAMFRTAGPAPPVAVPSGRFATRDEGAAALDAACEAIAAWTAAADVGLREHGARHPVFGVFDAVQWIRFVAAHTDSHFQQLRTLCEDAERRART